MPVLNLYVVHLSDRAVSILAVILGKCIPGKCVLATCVLGTLPILVRAILIRDRICNMGWNGILCRGRGASRNDQSCGDWKQRSHFSSLVESIGRVATNGQEVSVGERIDVGTTQDHADPLAPDLIAQWPADPRQSGRRCRLNGELHGGEQRPQGIPDL